MATTCVRLANVELTLTGFDVYVAPAGASGSRQYDAAGVLLTKGDIATLQLSNTTVQSQANGLRYCVPLYALTIRIVDHNGAQLAVFDREGDEWQERLPEQDQMGC